MKNQGSLVGSVFHDAGATYQGLSYIIEHYSQNIGYFEGPAAIINDEMRFNIENVSNYQEVVQNCDMLVTGSGWSSNLEFNALKLAKQLGKYTVTVIDHWVNYAERFERNGEIVLPDEIWVFDKYAFLLAEKNFCNVKIKLCTPTYTNYVVNSVSNNSIEPGAILYICEPIRLRNDSTTDIEYKILSNFLDTFYLINDHQVGTIYLKLHPSEHLGKYDTVIEKYNHLNITYYSFNLSNALSKCERVVGFNSYALYLAKAAGREVWLIGDEYRAKQGFDIRTILNFGI